MASPLARTVLVTGCSRGLGLEMVRQLAAAENPPKVIIATCRNPDKAPVSTMPGTNFFRGVRRCRPMPELRGKTSGRLYVNEH